MAEPLPRYAPRFAVVSNEPGAARHVMKNAGGRSSFTHVEAHRFARDLRGRGYRVSVVEDRRAGGDPR